MAEKYYSVDQIAEMIDMHPKTIQRYIREGKLKAQKIGKSWRVSGHDLSTFAEGTDGYQKSEASEGLQDIIMASENTIRISAVIDIPVKNNLDAVQVVNWISASMNSMPPEYGYKTMNSQYIEPDHIIRILLWGSAYFMGTIMSSLAEIGGK